MSSETLQKEGLFLGNRLKISRLKLGMTQNEFADGLSVGRSAYATYELGTRKTPVTVCVKASEVYGLNLEYLMKGEGSPFVTESVPEGEGYRIEYDDEADYTSFRDWLDDEEIQTLCNPSKDEIEELRYIKFRNAPDKRGWTDILTSLRRAKKRREV